MPVTLTVTIRTVFPHLFRSIPSLPGTHRKFLDKEKVLLISHKHQICCFGVLFCDFYFTIIILHFVKVPMHGPGRWEGVV